VDAQLQMRTDEIQARPPATELMLRPEHQFAVMHNASPPKKARRLSQLTTAVFTGQGGGFSLSDGISVGPWPTAAFHSD